VAMNYIKLLLPIGVAILLTILASFFEGQSSGVPLTIGIIIKGGIVISYLRLNNSRTPFINSLTGILFTMMIGEYLINTGIVIVGISIFIAANLGFIILYFLRHVMKLKKDKLMAIKTLAVAIYCLGNILCIFDVMGLAPLITGTMFISGVYFYDRLIKESGGVLLLRPKSFWMMEIDAMSLSRYFYTTLEFNDLKDRLKMKIGTNYKLGVIDNDEISIYYLKDWYTENGLDRVPTCKIEIKNKKREDGRVRIKFTVAKFTLVAIGVFPLISMAIFYFLKAPFPLYDPLALYPILYLVLLSTLSDQSHNFQMDLRKLETEAK
jgi:hypothetical protein